MNRRLFLTSGISMIALSRMARAFGNSPFFQGAIPNGPFLPYWESLKSYRCPEWFRDAKFGIWAHWSPQCVPEQGDWYARNMYIQGSAQYEYHVKPMDTHRSSDTKIFAIFGEQKNGTQERLSSSTSAREQSTS